jgi:phosphate-selective porin OprO/OprP
MKQLRDNCMHGMKNLSLVLLLLLGLTSQVAAQVIDPQNVVIENVYIATEGTEDVPVNLLIRDNKLELVSKDQIPVPDGCVALDAVGGYLIGNLALGEPPSFIILDADPRSDMEVLLDTKRRAVYAVYKGELRKNTLQYATSNILVAKKPEHTAWHGYTPPPVALPTHYGDNAPWNHWKTANTTGVFFAVLALDRNYWLSQNDDSEQQVGSLEQYDGGEIRDLRLGVFGTLNYFDKPWGYTVVVATNAFSKRFELEDKDNFKAIDYRLDIPVDDSMKLSIGKQKEPISMERIMTLIEQPMQERSSAADAFLLSRNFGILLSGNALDSRMSWAGGVFNDFIDTDESLDNGATSVTGRVTWLPFVSEDESNLVHLGLSARLSDGNQGYLYRTEPEFNKSPLFVDSGFGDADGINQYDLEASWRRGPFWLAAEHVGTFVDSPTNGNLNFSGYHVTTSWILTGEMRDYRYKSGTFGPVPISRSVYQNGLGAWEIAARWSSIDLNDGAVAGGEMDILSLAASWWLSPIFNVNLNYRYILNERDNLNGETSGVNIRILLKLQ